MYPEICMLELNLLSAGNASLDVLAHVFQSCLKIISQKERNATVLIEQVKLLLNKGNSLVVVHCLLFSFIVPVYLTVISEIFSLVMAFDKT